MQTFDQQTVDSSGAFLVGELERLDQTLNAPLSFYGPQGLHYASRFRDGITVSQNNAELNTYDLTLVSYSHIIPFAELISNQWVRRYDFTVRLRRKVVQVYNIRSLADAPFTVSGE